MARRPSPAADVVGSPSPVGYSYLRFSSHGQADGDSIRRQTANPEDWCQRNGVRLDTSLVFEDRARSAFKTHHKHREALSEFRRYITEGRIRPGSFLIIENLDRLSREQERIAFELLLNIVNAGVTIVQLMPEEQVFSPDNLDMLGMMRGIMQMAQAHQESAKKAKRLGEVWEEKRKAARSGTGTLTARVPGWVQLVDGRMKLDPARAALVRRIFRLCIQGLGGQAIARMLNQENVPTLTGRGKWYQSAVTHILRSRSALGEHQPHTEHGADTRVPVGEPIDGYYPRVIADDVFNAAQGAMAGRLTLAGRPPAKKANLFRRLLWDARGGCRVGILTRTKDGHVGQVFANSDRAAGEKLYSFPADTLEQAVLSMLREIDPREVVGESAAAERVLALTGERADLSTRLDKLVGLLGDEPSEVVMKKVREMEAGVRQLDDKLTLARQEAADPLASHWGELPGLLNLAGEKLGRERLAGTLRRVIDSIQLLIVSRGMYRLASVQVWFRGGTNCRNYIIVHRPARLVKKGQPSRPAAWWAKSFTSAALPDGLDLRRRDHAADLERVLAAIDPATLTADGK